MQTINLYDILTISIETSDNDEIILFGNCEDIPYNENNLVHKAAKSFLKTANLNECHSIKVNIEKNIPISAGLAGGSTDAAGTLFGLNKLFDEKLSNKDLNYICSTLGSDLNFCLTGGRAMTKGRGEIIEPIDFEYSKISLIKPCNLGISAKEAYTKFANKNKSGNLGRDKFLNDLEWAIIDDYPQLQKIKTLYPKSIMSGSGSTFFITDDEFSPLEGYDIYNNLETIPVGVCEV